MTIDAYPHIARPPEPGAPLIFAFHGTGGDETQFDGLVRQLLPDAGLVAPRGDVSEHGAARYFRRTGEGVYDMADLARATTKMTGFMRAHAAQHPEAPVMAMGYSNGANILASVMMAAPNLVSRAALLHPLIPWQPTPVQGLAGKAVLVTGGRADPICPLPLTEALIEWLEAQGAVVETLIHPGGHDLRHEELHALLPFLSAAATA